MTKEQVMDFFVSYANENDEICEFEEVEKSIIEAYNSGIEKHLAGFTM